MKKFILIAIMVVINGFSYSQQTISISQSDLNSSTLKLSKDWILEIQKQDILIKNGRISNLSSSSSGSMKLELYFGLSPFDSDSDKINGYPVSSFAVNSTNGNSSLTGITIQFTDKNLPPDGMYYPVLLLTQAGKVKDAVQIRYQVNVSDSNVLILQKEEKQNTIVSVSPSAEVIHEKPNATNTSGFTNPSEPVKMVIKNDNSAVLENDWKLEIDYKKFEVLLTGGNIANNSNKDIQHLKIDVFLTKEKQTDISNSFNGLLIASAPFDKPLESWSKFVNTSIKTNLRAIPSANDRYILMTVSEIGSDGKVYLKSYRAFDNPIAAN